ncbi:DUF1674 domain-containing protein [Pseudovibrio exalbescens]|uniref:DUF1674 domain-containing protein n=1 Tax=Pseudovibrio exalbescens TaxID=197461 RepID=A0A1U7JJ19_9HYPH|nr:DUF1674 domain-containing protein [Pseudovibrio exalbescens]OKL44651.1 hypothetical protein A3843_09795 [Pseudovibrio exalbescens]
MTADNETKTALNYSSHDIDTTPPEEVAPKKKRFEDLPPAAQRALKEAEERRAQIDAVTKQRPTEVDGRGGLDPARYSDWEVKGIASDF